MSEKDIKPVLLQHPDGYRALVSGQVDAWAGLDPHMAKGELETQTPLFYRNADLNTYGILNVREEFSTKYPLLVKKVLKIYEENRLHAIKNPNELLCLARHVQCSEFILQASEGKILINAPFLVLKCLMAVSMVLLHVCNPF